MLVLVLGYELICPCLSFKSFTPYNNTILMVLCLTDRQHSFFVVRGAAGVAIALSEFRVAEKRTEREIDSPLLSAPWDLKA